MHVSDVECVGRVVAQGFDNRLWFNGEWTASHALDDAGNAYYTKDGMYLYYIVDWQRWIMGDTLGSPAVYAYCSAQDIRDCLTTWYVYDSGIGWESESVVLTLYEDGCTRM